MGKVLDVISDELAAWIAAQPMFFVATAPLAADGHVNLSPKGLDGTFAVLAPDRVAYLDLTGSGAETVAHARENGRITLMFCAFGGRPKICRLHGTAIVHPAGSAGFADLESHFPPRVGRRSIIEVRVARVSSSCGFGVPIMTLEGQRSDLTDWAERKSETGMPAYWAQKNAASIDGLPAVEAVEKTPAP